MGRKEMKEQRARAIAGLSKEGKVTGVQGEGATREWRKEPRESVQSATRWRLREGRRGWWAGIAWELRMWKEGKGGKAGAGGGDYNYYQGYTKDQDDAQGAEGRAKDRPGAE